jgi:hypothetical protein
MRGYGGESAYPVGESLLVHWLRESIGPGGAPLEAYNSELLPQLERVLAASLPEMPSGYLPARMGSIPRGYLVPTANHAAPYAESSSGYVYSSGYHANGGVWPEERTWRLADDVEEAIQTRSGLPLGLAGLDAKALARVIARRALNSGWDETVCQALETTLELHFSDETSPHYRWDIAALARNLERAAQEARVGLRAVIELLKECVDPFTHLLPDRVARVLLTVNHRGATATPTGDGGGNIRARVTELADRLRVRLLFGDTVTVLAGPFRPPPLP